MDNIKKGSILEGPFWPERIKVLTISKPSNEHIKIEAVGLQTRQLYDPFLTTDEIQKIRIVNELNFDFAADAEKLFLLVESHRIRNACQFDPLYAVNVSQVNPLPHQIEAIYHYILKNPRIRFMLADDPGAGKTIMAGLLLKELKYRGLVERTLIVVPGHLKDQWRRELKERFNELFTVINRDVMRSEWGTNIFKERSQAITSIDFAKQEDVAQALASSIWDLIIVDEAHKMSAYKYGEKLTKTLSYNLGELLSGITNYLLFLTATPHRGDPENFRLLLDLLEPGFFATTQMLEDSINNKDNPLFLRRLKEDIKNFDKTPLFPPRHVETLKYSLSEDETALYNKVTDYVREHFNKALQKEKRNVAFALMILQRRLASSARAIRMSLERRCEKLKKLRDTGKYLREKSNQTKIGDDYEDYLEDLEESYREQLEEDLITKLTSAETIAELNDEINHIEILVDLAKDVEKKGIETKLQELQSLMKELKSRGSHFKLLIFTESRDTLYYLHDKLARWGYKVTLIHGGLDLDARIRAEHEFKNKEDIQILISTEAGGEGINLQFCSLMVNYDIPWNPNRLEQRMGRIHRYGQPKEVFIYNMVASDTLEGRILRKLFDKLEQIKKNMGSDRVFDVIGDVTSGKNLKSLITEAITQQRNIEEILKEFDRASPEEEIRKVRESTDEALATKHIDFSVILSDQRKAKENKLVPEYIFEFFKKASQMYGVKYEERKDGLLNISSINNKIREKPHDFRIKYGDVHNTYNKVSFDKETAFKKQAEFIAIGHPLLESIIDEIINNFDSFSQNGATFVDLDGKLNGLLYILEGTINDGSGKPAGRRLFTVFQDHKGALHFKNPSILWDMQPASPIKASLEIPINVDKATSFVVSNGLQSYKQELLEERQKNARIKEKYGIRSIDSMIGVSESKLMGYEIRRSKAENIPEVVIKNEREKRADLDKKKSQLLKNISESVSLSSETPKLITVVRIQPEIPTSAVQPVDEEAKKRIELVGMKVAMEYEKKEGRTPEDVSSLKCGFDIKSKINDNEYRYIEVKARAISGDLSLTPNEWLMATRLKHEYWLYIVENASANPKLCTIQDPANNLERFELKGTIANIIKEEVWKKYAK